MKTRIAYIKILTLLVTLTATLIFATQGRSDEGDNRASFHWSGLLGVAMGESASLNFTNGDRRATEVHLAFLDASGAVLKSVTARVAAGHSFGLILPYSETNSRTGRVQVRPLVRLATPSDAARSISTVEVFDDVTGRTSFGLLLPYIRGLDPQPNLPAPSEQ